MEKSLDLTPYLITPYIIYSRAPLVTVYDMFRTLGLRHIIIINKRNIVKGIITRDNLNRI